MRHQTIYKWKGAAAAAQGWDPWAGGTRRCRRTLSFVYGLMSHCIDRFFHFVFYLYTFHFMLPMCSRLIFLVIFSIFLLFMILLILFIFHVFIFFQCAFWNFLTIKYKKCALTVRIFSAIYFWKSFILELIFVKILKMFFVLFLQKWTF